MMDTFSIAVLEFCGKHFNVTKCSVNIIVCYIIKQQMSEHQCFFYIRKIEFVQNEISLFS